MAIDDRMTNAALSRAQTHVRNVCATGSDIQLIKPSTSSSKDEFGAIVSASALDLKAFPVRFSPFDRVTLQRITWAENVDILCYVSKLAVDNLSVTIKQLKKKYSRLKYGGYNYDIRYIEYYNAFANDWLYIIVGGTK
jgi:hypothetical protein